MLEVLLDYLTVDDTVDVFKISHRIENWDYDELYMLPVKILLNPMAYQRARNTFVKDLIESVEAKFKFLLDDNSWLLLRASGTEPLLRAYMEATSEAGVAALKVAAHALAPDAVDVTH